MTASLQQKPAFLRIEMSELPTEAENLAGGSAIVVRQAEWIRYSIGTEAGKIKREREESSTM